MSVLIVYSHRHSALCDLLPSNPGRSSYVHGVLERLGLLEKCVVAAPLPISRRDLLSAHDAEFVDLLLSPNLCDTDQDVLEEYGFVDDCPAFPHLREYVQTVVGGTIKACEAILNGVCKIAIHFDGGRHHAHAHRASGFCYVNDVVIGIQYLLDNGFRRVLYIDLDLHHGDGVQEAFEYTDTVMTVSFHLHAPGFFPGTGEKEDKGRGRGKGYTRNIPLCRGLSDATLIHQFDDALPAIYKEYNPDVMVLQLGVDGLATDPLHEWNLTPAAYIHCVQRVLSFRRPVVLLGGGGYHTPSVSLCYAHLLASLLDVSIPLDTIQPRAFCNDENT